MKIEIAKGARLFHNGREIVVIPEENATNYIKSKAYNHKPITELFEIQSAIERQESICFFSGSLLVSDITTE